MQNIVYLIIILFPASPSDNIKIDVVGRYTVAQCDFIKNTISPKHNQLVVCANIRDL